MVNIITGVYIIASLDAVYHCMLIRSADNVVNAVINDWWSSSGRGSGRCCDGRRRRTRLSGVQSVIPVE